MTDTTWFKDLPSNWRRSRLKYLADFQAGENITAESIRPNSEFPVYGGNGLRGFADAYTHDGEYILVGRQGALCGNVNYAAGKFWASEHAVVVKPHTGVHVKWLGELLRAMNLGQYSMSAAQPGLSVEYIINLPAPLPPLEAQRRIVDYLTPETARIDALISAKERLLDLLTEKRRALITHVVTRGLNPDTPLRDSGLAWLGRIPSHWDIIGFTRHLRSLVDYRGRTPEKSSSGVFLVTARNIRDGEIDYGISQEYITEDAYAEVLQRGVPRTNHLLLTTEAPLGQVALVDREDIALAQRVIKLDYQPEKLLNEYALYWIRSDVFQWQLMSYATGSTALGIKGERLHLLRNLIPPLEEQRAIIKILKERIGQFAMLVRANQSTIDLLCERRSALIAAGVTGQLQLVVKG
ncbi:MAG: restriction endonuclease subunit S [Planctomycetota bacterium]|nr:restriction endonuclease subunit S [Planctomycetota bacterium]